MATNKTTHHPGVRSGPRAPFLIDDGIKQIQVESLGSLARALVNVRDVSAVRIIDAAGRVWSHDHFMTAVPAPDEEENSTEQEPDESSGFSRWLTVGGILMVAIGLLVLMSMGRSHDNTGGALAIPATKTEAHASSHAIVVTTLPTMPGIELTRDLVGRYLYQMPKTPPTVDPEARGAAAIEMVKDPDLGQPAGVFDGRGWLAVPRLVDEDFSITFWVQTRDMGGKDDFATAQWFEGVGLVNAEVGGVREDFGITVLGGEVAFGVGNPDVTAHSTTAINDGRWYHVAVLRDNLSGTMALFINGLPNQVLQGAPGRRSAPEQIIVGAHSPAWGHLHGKLADLRFYKRQLSVQEISALAGQVTAP